MALATLPHQLHIGGGNPASKQTAKTIGILLNAISIKVRDLGSYRPPTPQMLRGKVNVF